MRWLDRLALAALIGTAAAFALGELGRTHWRLELLSHFAVQYALALAATGGYFLLRRRPLWAAMAALALLLPAWRLAPYLPIADAPTQAAGSHRLRVMSINVHARNQRHAAVRAEIERFDPDIVFLAESTERWAAALAPLRARYPYVIDGKSESVFSLFLFSRVPLAEASIVELPASGRFRTIAARLCPEPGGGAAGCVRLLGVHPPPPLSAGWAAERDAVLAALPGLMAAPGGGPTIVLGDFNCSPWSPVYRDLAAATGLRDSALGFGAGATWFSRWLPLGLKIDHILIGGGITATAHAIGRDVGSDHYAVVADLQF